MANIAEAGRFDPKAPPNPMTIDTMRRGGYQLPILHDMDLAYLQSGDIDKALADADRVVHRTHRRDRRRGNLWQRKGEREKALADYLAAVASKPPTSMTRRSLICHGLLRERQ